MIKRSAILLLLLAAGSLSLLVFTSYSAAETKVPAKTPPVKCSGCKKITAPLQWNIVSPAVFPTES